jgi:enterochelin esterase-like enzyme
MDDLAQSARESRSRQAPGDPPPPLDRPGRAGAGRGGALAALVVWGVLASPSADAGEVTRRGFESPLLEREYRYSLYLPDGYASGHARYPVLYLLHGSVGDESEWVEAGNVRATTDRLIAAGEIPPLVIVMPGHSLSWWVDGNQEPAATVLLEELIPHVDANLRTVARREGRLLAGLSAGGYGTVNLALSHPDLFAAAAAFSPAVYLPLPPPSSGARRTPQFSRNGTFDPETWQRLSHQPRLERYVAGDLVVPFYLMSGDHDALGIALHTTRLFDRLWRHQPDAVELRIVDGGHDWPVWRAALPDALRYMCRFVTTDAP